MNLGCKVLQTLEGKTLVTAESITGGGIGMTITTNAGASEVYKGGVITYTNEAKEKILGVPHEMLETKGAVSAPVAEAMAEGVRKLLNADIAISVTGLAGPGGDEFGNPVGTVFIGYSDKNETVSKEFHFVGNRSAVRQQTIIEALQEILVHN